MVFDSPLRESNTAYKLAAQLDQKVAARLQQIEKQTESARPAPFLRAGSQHEPPVDLARITRSRSSLREAFVASLVFGKPPALDPSHGLPWS
jgi:hypothetical protein